MGRTNRHIVDRIYRRASEPEVQKSPRRTKRHCESIWCEGQGGAEVYLQTVKASKAICNTHTIHTSKAGDPTLTRMPKEACQGNGPDNTCHGEIICTQPPFWSSLLGQRAVKYITSPAGLRLKIAKGMPVPSMGSL